MPELMEWLRSEIHVVIALIVAAVILYAMDRHHWNKTDERANDSSAPRPDK